MTRTTTEKTKLRDSAKQLIAGDHFELDNDETTGDGQCPVQVGPVVGGVVVDRQSQKGRVVVTGKGVEPQYVKTGPGESGDPYPEIRIQDGQTCVIYGLSTVIYYRPR